MKKSFFGSVEGYKARKYPAYKYRVLERPFLSVSARHTVWGEELVYPLKEYPRRNPTIKSSVPVFPHHERVDFIVEIGEEVVEVFLLPGTYTAAKERKRIFKFSAKTEKMPKIDELFNWAVTTAFL
jgi:hypothetical protein